MPKQLVEFNDYGIYCAAGDFYVDPWKPVKYAVLTHAHADHARWGSQNYLAHDLSAAVLKYRLGAINLETLPYEQTLLRNGVKISFHPAGHIIGSAQVRIEYKGEVWVISGDYKVEEDGLTEPFQPVKCHSFVSECTFGMPVYKWKPQHQVFEDINQWCYRSLSEGRTPVLAGYSLGKAQRIMHHLDPSIGVIYTHGAIENTNEALRSDGVELPQTTRVTAAVSKEDLKRGIVICPPSAIGSPWIKKFYPFNFGYCSGWMALRGAKRRMAADRGFVISDHADWSGLLQAIKATGCESVYLTHGYTASFSRYLYESGFNAHEAKTLYGGDEATGSDELPVDLVDPEGDVIRDEKSVENMKEEDL